MNRIELLKKLETVGRALADSNLVPIFQCFVFDGSDVSAYNDAIGVITQCTTDAAFAVDGKTLMGLLATCQSEEVDLKIEGHELIARSGRSTFKLPYHQQESFIFKEPDDEFTVSVNIDENTLKGLAACLTTSSRDTSQPALMGIKLNGNLYSSDGDVLTRYTLTTGEWPTEYMLPNAFCEAVLKVGGSGNLELSGGWAKATVPGFVIYGRLIENPNPIDFEDVIKQTLKARPHYAAIPAGLDEALARARIVADPESKPTTLTVEGNRLKLLTDTHLGVVKDVLVFKHPDVQALASAELLQRSVRLSTEMCVMDNCCSFRSGDQLFQLLSNFG